MRNTAIACGLHRISCRSSSLKHGQIYMVMASSVVFEGSIKKIVPGHRSEKRKAWFDKDPSVYLPRQNGAPSIVRTIALQSLRDLMAKASQVDANEQDHTRFRRLLAHAFSEKALRNQEPVLQTYVNLLISKLHEQSSRATHGVVDMVRQVFSVQDPVLAKRF